MIERMALFMIAAGLVAIAVMATFRGTIAEWIVGAVVLLMAMYVIQMARGET